MNVRNKVAAYLTLTKPRIALMVLFATAMGYGVAGPGFPEPAVFFLTLLGTVITSAGASALNHCLEQDVDARMERTRNRPIPAGRISALAAMNFGAILVMTGCFILLWSVNILAAFLALESSFLYVLVYTPMKRLTHWNTAIGAIPGAMPPLIGWAGATGTLDAGAWVFFAILYIWQQPHSHAIAWMFREDYARGGLKMLSVVKPDGRALFAQVIGFSALLIPVSLLPILLGITGWVYCVGAITIGFAMLGASIAFSKTRSKQAGRMVLRASVLYLPLLLLLLLADPAF